MGQRAGRSSNLIAWLRHWVTSRATDEALALGERAVYALTLPMIVVTAASLVTEVAVWSSGSAFLWMFLTDAIGLVGMTLVYMLARRGRIRLSIVLMLCIDLAVVASHMCREGYQSVNPLLLLLAIAAAGLTLGARAGFLVATLSSVLYGLMALAEARGWFTPSSALPHAENVFFFALIVYLLAGLTAIFGSWVYRAQRERARLLSGQMDALAEAGREKDELLQAVRQKVAEQEMLLARLEAGDQAQARLRIELQQVSNPVIPVHDQVVVMPILGSLSVERMQRFTQDLLEGVERYSARLALLDVTGVPEMDGAVAEVLLQMVDAVALLGAECVLVGIRPETAHTMVNLGIDLGQVTSRRDLQGGIEYALERTGRRVVATS